MEGEVNKLLAGLILNELGFQDPSESNIPNILKKIYPKGGTALRDSLIGGCNLLIKLNQLLQKTGTSNTWNFVHVILTDGIDQNSNASLQDTLQIMMLIGQHLNVKTLKIIIIGVGVSNKAQNQLKAIAKVAGQNAQYYSVAEAEIEKIFQRITVNLGLQKRQQLVGIANKTGAAFFLQENVSPVLSLQMQNFAVLLNLDVSGSMAGQKWRSVCQSVDKFTDFLGERDLIAAMVFNHEAKLLSKLESDDDLFKQPQQEQKKQNTTIVIQTQNGKQVAMNPEDCAIY